MQESNLQFNLNLSVQQIEQAFKFLTSRYQTNPPEELQHLNNDEWLQLQNLLLNLQYEKQCNLLH